jgi:Leucine-rich repeat (LRR) protein
VCIDGVNAVGEIPTEVGLLSSLEYLWLDSNSLFGSIPPELFELPNLQSVSIADNGLSGTLPSEIGLATELWTLDLSENQIGGTLDNVVGPNMTYLALQGNFLEGTIPLDFSSMTNIYYLNLGDNRLSGPLPTNLVNLESLAVLSLYDNFGLTGSVPPAYSSFNLSLLYLDRTGLTDLEDVFCSSGLLEFEEFYADCGGTPSKVQCWCCTHCCDDISCYAN